VSMPHSIGHVVAVDLGYGGTAIFDDAEGSRFVIFDGLYSMVRKRT
jgi:hypothetical protein